MACAVWLWPSDVASDEKIIRSSTFFRRSGVRHLFWDVFCVVYIFMCAHILVILLSLLLFFFYFSLDLPVANLCSAFKRVLLSCCVSVCCWMMPTAVLSLSRSPSILLIYTVGKAVAVDLLFFSVSFSFLNASAWLRLNSGARRISFFNKGRQERKKWAEKQVN